MKQLVTALPPAPIHKSEVITISADDRLSKRTLLLHETGSFVEDESFPLLPSNVMPFTIILACVYIVFLCRKIKCRI